MKSAGGVLYIVRHLGNYKETHARRCGRHVFTTQARPRTSKPGNEADLLYMLTLWCLNDPYRGRTAPLTSKRCILYIYSTKIGTEYFKHGIYSPFFSSSKCNLFHNSNVFGSCIIHILYTGCAKIKRNDSGAKRLMLRKLSIPVVLVRIWVCKLWSAGHMNTAKNAVSLADIFHICLCHKFCIFLKPIPVYGKGVKWQEIKCNSLMCIGPCIVVIT